MKLSKQLELIAEGIYPETGEVISQDSIVHDPITIRLLYRLAKEISEYEKSARKKNKFNPEEKRRKNNEEGKPLKSHFPWEEPEKEMLKKGFESGNSIEKLAHKHERSALAIAAQLNKFGLLDEQIFEAYREKKQA